MKKSNFVRERGYSLVEMLIVLVITAVLVTFVVARFGRAKQQFGRQNIARELKINLERARFDSVKRHAELTVSGGVTTDLRAEVIIRPTSFDVTTDRNQNGTLDATDTKTVDFSGQNNVKISDKDKDGNTLVFPISIKFDRYGRIEAKNGATPAQNVTPIFTVCTDNCTAADATASNADVIYVSPSGTVAMLKGDESKKGKPNFNSPGVSAVPANTFINQELRVKSATNSAY